MKTDERDGEIAREQRFRFNGVEAISVACVRAGRRAVLEEVRERNSAAGYYECDCREQLTDSGDWCDYCWASAELERLKGEP